jgi:sec-independent protein translocase protein TatA
VIAVVAIIFLIYGPKKIPQLARSIGLARKEFNDASKIVTGDIPPATSTDAVTPATTSTGDSLIETAKKLGISTEGKTREEISEEIVKKAQQRN